MKRPGGILLALALMGLLVLAGIVFAQEMMEKTGEEADTASPMIARGMGRGMRGPGMMGMGEMPAMGHRGRMAMTGWGGMMSRRGRGPGRAGMVGRMGIMARLAGKLDLSEEQKDQINNILTAHKKDMIRKNSEREIAEVELRELMRQENPDLDLIENQIRKVADLGAGMRYSQIKTHLDVKNVLTEEQREALKEMPKEKGEQTRERRGQVLKDRPGRGRGTGRRRR